MKCLLAGLACLFLTTAIAFGETDHLLQLIRIHTSLGAIEVELDQIHAPKTVANFLKYVDAGRYTGGQFHRTVRTHPDNQPHSPVKIEVVQGGVNPNFTDNNWAAVALERTSATGLKHVDGTISMGRRT